LARDFTDVPEQRPGTVRLYDDMSWDSPFLEIDTAGLRTNIRHTLTRPDHATWVAYNLPVWDVVTLCDDVTETTGGHISELLKNCGRIVDLIGTGKTEAVDLIPMNMNDCASTYIYRHVVPAQGWVELFEDVNYEGNRTCVFFSDFEFKRWHSLSQWYICGRMSSVRRKNLPPDVAVQLCEMDSNGKYNDFNRIGVIWRDKPDLRGEGLPSHRLNDCINTFGFFVTPPMGPVS